MSGTNQPLPFDRWEDIETFIQGLSATQLDTLKPGRNTSGDKYLVRPRDAFFTSKKDVVIGRILQHRVSLANNKYRVIMILELYNNQKFYLLQSTKGPPNFHGWTGNGWTANTWIYGEMFLTPEKEAMHGDAQFQTAQAHILQHRPNDHNKNSWIHTYHPRGATSSSVPPTTTAPTVSISENNTATTAVEVPQQSSTAAPLVPSTTEPNAQPKTKAPKPATKKTKVNKNDSTKLADGSEVDTEKVSELRPKDRRNLDSDQKNKNTSKAKSKPVKASIASETIPVAPVTQPAVPSSNRFQAINLPHTPVQDKKRKREIEFEQEITSFEAKRQCQAFLEGWRRDDPNEPTQHLVGLAYIEWNTPIYRAQETNPHHLQPWKDGMGGPGDIQHELPTNGLKHIYRYTTSQQDAVYTTAPVSRNRKVIAPGKSRGVQQNTNGSQGQGFYELNATQKTALVKQQRDALRTQATMLGVVPHRLEDLDEQAEAAARQAFYDEQKTADDLEALLPDESDSD